MAQTFSISDGLAEARSYLGCKWRHRGRSRFGIDCLGLIVAYLRAGGRHVEDRAGYGREPWKDGLESGVSDQLGERLDYSNAREGDIALIRWDSNGQQAHIGIITAGKNGFRLLHSHSACGVVEHDIDAAWRDRIVGVYRP